MAVCGIGIASSVFAQRQTLSGHVPRMVRDLNLQPVGRLSPTQHIYLAIGVSLRDAEGAQRLLQKLYDPSDALYHQYLTPVQFTERFGPTEPDYEAVLAFAKTSGFRVVATHPNRLLLDVDATAADVERAFQVKLYEYQPPREGRKFYAPDVEPSVPSGLKIADISGLNDYSRPHPNSLPGGLGAPMTGSIPNGGSIPGGQYIGNDFRSAYIPGTPLTGIGQTVALVQFDGYYPSDIARYETLAGLPAVTLTNVYLDSFSGNPTSNTNAVGEVSLDIEMSISMAPGLSKVMVYEGNPNNFIPNDVLSQIANDNAAKQISCSWGWTGGPSTSTDNIFIQMADQGQSFFVASGDSDAYPGSTADSTSGFGTPAVSAYVTSVGGTTLSTAGPTNNWTSETVWNWGVEYSPHYNGVGSSGGYSAYYGIPTWQQGVSAGNLGSTAGRNFPDVALTADHVFVAYFNGLTNWFGGTSCASPLWAGFTALVNQQAAANGKSPVGFINPALYTIGTGTTYTACFHDVTTGNNEWSNSPSAYTALSGYDLCTGWGSPNGTNLINTLVGPLTNAYLELVGSTISGGNGNGTIDADECNFLNLIVQNIGVATAASVDATLATTTPGVTITQPSSFYPDVGPSSSATNTTPFQISTQPSFVCGTPVSLSLVLTYTGGSATNTLSLPTCVCPGFQTNDGVTAGSRTQTGRLTRNYTVSTCASSKSCPGYLTTSGAYPYQAYSFTNSTSNAVCVTVNLITPCQGQSSTGLFTAAYLGNFNSRSLCSGYLADQGGMLTTSGTYSFDVPANTNFTVVVNDVSANSYCGSYNLTVSGLPCFVDGGGSCSLAPEANFTANPSNGAAPLAVSFVDTSSGAPTSWAWDFGDGNTSTSENPSHAYATPGSYTAQLIASNVGGSSTNTQVIGVYDPFAWWRNAYFGSTNSGDGAPDADAFGTGMSNTNKFLAGFNPTNPAAYLHILDIVETNTTDIEVTYQGANGDVTYSPGITSRTNVLEFTDGAPDGSYSNAFTSAGQTNILSGGTGLGVVTNMVDPGGATNVPSRYYRVRVLLP